MSVRRRFGARMSLVFVVALVACLVLQVGPSAALEETSSSAEATTSVLADTSLPVPTEPAVESTVAPSPVPADGCATQTLPWTRYEEGQGPTYYTPGWVSYASTSASGGTLKYTVTSAARAYVYFRGTGIRVIGPVGPNYAKFDLWGDGIPYERVDQYAAIPQSQQVLYEVTGLSDGFHVLSMMALAGSDPNPASTGRLTLLDAFEVQGVLEAPPVAEPAPVLGTRFEETHPLLKWSGDWRSYTSAAASGGSMKYTAQEGATLEIPFKGTGIQVVGPRGPNYGSMTVYIDGTNAYTTSVSQRSSYFMPQQSLYVRTGLDAGYHTLKIVCTPTIFGNLTLIDAIDVQGVLEAPPQYIVPEPFGAVRIEQTDPNISYSPGWRSYASPWQSGGTLMYSATAGDTMSVRMSSFDFVIIGPRGPNYGEFDVYVDGVWKKTVSQYSSTYQPQGWLYHFWMGAGYADRLVTIRVRGTKSAQSTGTLVLFDAIDIEDAWGETRPNYYFEEGAREIVYGGPWRSCLSSGATAGQLRYATECGASAVLSFECTEESVVGWVGPVGPSYGLADVYLDGEYWGTVSQYEPAAEHQVLVWGDFVEPGRHTLQIRALGQHEPASGASTILIDGVYIDPGTKLMPAAHVPLAANGVRLEDSLWSALGWKRCSSTAASGGSLTYTVTPGASLAMTLELPDTLSLIRLVGPVGPRYGQSTLLVNGTSYCGIDQYSPVAGAQQELAYLFYDPESGELGAPGDILRVCLVASGRKLAWSTGTTVLVDALQVESYPTDSEPVGLSDDGVRPTLNQLVATRAE